MKIANKNYKIEGVFDTTMTVPDCFVVTSNKLGDGHGEAKFYIAPKDEMYAFYGAAGFTAKCLLLKNDLINYMMAIESEYKSPSQPYRDAERLGELWQQRFETIQQQDDVIEFTITDQAQIAGPRGYVKSNDAGYNLIRDIALPLVSYISAMKLRDEDGNIIFYWRLFVDADAILQQERTPMVFTYGTRGQCDTDTTPPDAPQAQRAAIAQARVGQGKYREKLLEECPYCPITKISDERLLVASHIKPWYVCESHEKTDPNNGFILSPLYDKLFDKGFITFTDDRRLLTSPWISNHNWQKMGIKNNTFIANLPMNDARKVYLAYHRKHIFNGTPE